MLSTPRIDERREQPYLAVRFQVPMDQLPTIIPQGIAEVHGWLMEHGLRPAGAPFIRYHVVNMPGLCVVSVGWPVATATEGSGRIVADVLPAGRYASVIYTGNYPGLPEANGSLLDWGAQQGLTWDSWTTDQGHAFGSRMETYWTNPQEEPDLKKHETEIAIRLAEG